jgi:hypothetical protein
MRVRPSKKYSEEIFQERSKVVCVGGGFSPSSVQCNPAEIAE